MPSALIWDLLVRDGATGKLDRIATAGDRAATSLARTQTRVDAVSAKMAAAGARLTKSVTLPLVAVAAVGVDQAAKYQKSMTLIQTAAGETATKTAAIQKGILGLAKSTGTSLDDLSDGIYTVAKAGAQKWSAAGQLNVLKAAAQGAKAENVDLGTSVSALTSVMQGYGLSANKAVTAENEIIRASGLSKTSMQEFAGSLANVIPLASALHISFAQVGGAIATMTQHGEGPERATQNLNNLIRNLAGSNNVAVQAMGQLGLKSQDVAKQLATKNGLSGALNMVEQAMARNSKGGRIVVSAFKVAQNATHDLGVEIDHMPPALAKLSSQFESGKLSYLDYNTAVKGLGGQQYALGKNFIATMAQAKGFSNALKSGNPQVQTSAQAFQKLLGGATGMNAALMLSGASSRTFHSATDEIAAAADHAGVNVLGWGKTSKTLSVQLDEAKENLQVLAVEIGTELIPAVTKTVGWVTNAVDWFDNLGSGTKEVIGYTAAFAAALGPVLFVGGKVVSVVRGIGTAYSALAAAGTRTAGFFTGTTAAATESSTAVSGSEARAAAVWAESQARKAAATAESAVEIGAALEREGIALTAEMQATVSNQIEFAAAMRAKAEAAITAASTITAAESGLTESMTAAESAQLASARATAAGVIAASREQAAGVETSAGRIATASRSVAGLALAGGAGYLGGSLAGSAVSKHVDTQSAAGLWGVFGSSVGGGAAGGAAFGGAPGALIGAAAGSIAGVAKVWSDVHANADAAGKAAQAALEQQKAAAQDLLQTLTSVGGAYDQQYRQNVVSKLSSSGALAIANKAGVNVQGLTEAVIGKGGPRTLVNLTGQLENAFAAGKITGKQMSVVIGTLQRMAPAATSAEKALELQNKALGQGVLPASELGTSVSKLRAAMRDTAGSLDGETAAGQRNIAIVGQNVQALNAGAAAQLKHGRSVQSVTSSYEAQIGTLAANLHQMGYNGSEIDTLVGKYAHVPKAVATRMSAQGLIPLTPAVQALIEKYQQIPASKSTNVSANTSGAVNNLARVHTSVDSLPTNKTITITTVTRAVHQAAATILGGVSGAKATGGLITGPGTGTNDQAGLYALSNREFVSTARSVDMNHAALEAGNRGARLAIAGMATGGTPPGPYKLKNGDWTFRGTTTHYDSKRAADNAFRSYEKQTAQQRSEARKSKLEAAAERISTAVSGIGQASSPQFTVGEVSISRVRAQIAAVRNALDDAHLTPKARAKFEQEIKALTKLANKQLAALRVHIRHTDVAAIGTAIRTGTATDIRSAFSTALTDLGKAGAPKALTAMFVDAQLQALAGVARLSAAKTRLSSMKAFQSSVAQTLGGYDLTTSGSVEDFRAGLQGETATNMAYRREVKGLDKRAGHNKADLALINELAASGQSATLAALAADPSQLASAANDYEKYRASVAAGAATATGSKYGESVQHQVADVAKLVSEQHDMLGALGELAAAFVHAASRPVELEGKPIADLTDKQVTAAFHKLEHEMAKGRHG